MWFKRWKCPPRRPLKWHLSDRHSDDALYVVSVCGEVTEAVKDIDTSKKPRMADRCKSCCARRERIIKC